jgi:hypothetical protein
VAEDRGALSGLTGSSLHAVRCRGVCSRPHLCVSRLCRCPLDAARLAGGGMVVCQLFPAGMRAALGLGMTARRFPPPWSVEETDACFAPKLPELLRRPRQPVELGHDHRPASRSGGPRPAWKTLGRAGSARPYTDQPRLSCVIRQW